MIDMVAIGRLVQRLRERSGFTQEDVASFVGVPRSGISRLEHGERDLTYREAVRLAELLRVPISEFIADDFATEPAELYRAQANELALDPAVFGGVQEVISRYLSHVRLARRHGLTSSEESLLVSSRHLGEGRHAAHQRAFELRNSLGLSAGPVPDVFEAIDQLGVFYLRYPFGNQAISGFAGRRASLPFLCTNSSKTLGRERYSAAHELYHVLYHLNAAGESLIVDHDRPEVEQDVREKGAEEFAADFLMPHEGVLDFWTRRIGRSSAEVKPFHVIDIQHHFGVSYSAMLLRLRRLDLISETDYQRLEPSQLPERLGGPMESMGFGADLARPYGRIAVPRSALNRILLLFESDVIPYDAARDALASIGLTPDRLGIAALGPDAAHAPARRRPTAELLKEIEDNLR